MLVALREWRSEEDAGQGGEEVVKLGSAVGGFGDEGGGVAADGLGGRRLDSSGALCGFGKGLVN